MLTQPPEKIQAMVQKPGLYLVLMPAPGQGDVGVPMLVDDEHRVWSLHEGPDGKWVKDMILRPDRWVGDVTKVLVCNPKPDGRFSNFAKKAANDN